MVVAVELKRYCSPSCCSRMIPLTPIDACRPRYGDLSSLCSPAVCLNPSWAVVAIPPLMLLTPLSLAVTPERVAAFSSRQSHGDFRRWSRSHHTHRSCRRRAHTALPRGASKPGQGSRGSTSGPSLARCLTDSALGRQFMLLSSSGKPETRFKYLPARRVVALCHRVLKMFSVPCEILAR